MLVHLCISHSGSCVFWSVALGFFDMSSGQHLLLGALPWGVKWCFLLCCCLKAFPSECFPRWLCTFSVPLGCCHIPNGVYSSWIWDAHQLSAEIHSASRISSQEWDGKKELSSSFITKGSISYTVQQLRNCFPGWGSNLQHLQCCCKTNPDLHNSSGIFPQVVQPNL